MDINHSIFAPRSQQHGEASQSKYFDQHFHLRVRGGAEIYIFAELIPAVYSNVHLGQDQTLQEIDVRGGHRAHRVRCEAVRHVPEV